ncbi:MAG: hypothetical protein JWP75_3690 [Frondihabitans sp.]|nr:hypothetical protein [Frondihabitans sp.]
MDKAQHISSETTYTAVKFSKLSPAFIATYRGDLACSECGWHAYFVSKSINGKPPFFGARPHGPGCELATTTGEKNEGDLPVTNAREAQEGVLRLQGQRDNEGVQHVEHDPDADEHKGKGRRYVFNGEERGLSTPTIAMNRLLHHLINDPEYREDRQTKLIMPNGGEMTVRDFCVEMNDVNRERHANRRYLYWGVIIYAKETTWGERQSGGTKTSVWLYTAPGLPNILLDQDLYDLIVRRKHIQEIGDLSGATFLYFGYMNISQKKLDDPEKKLLFMHPKDPLWFVVRLASQDADR